MSQTRVLHELTAEEAERFDRLAELVEAEKPDIIRRYQLIETAAQEPGFNGDLRRAIHGGHVPLSNIATAAQMDVFAICEFLEGTQPLTSTQIAAISDCLGLQLVRRIADPQPKRKS